MITSGSFNALITFQHPHSSSLLLSNHSFVNMNMTQRRCRSEQIPSTANRAIAPHKAAKLRQAQLLVAQKCDLLSGNPTKRLTFETNHRDEKQLATPNALLPAQNAEPTGTNLQTNPAAVSKGSPKRRPEQVDGTFHLPSIDTVISAVRARDERRQQGKPEFYEQQGDDSVIRRRSMMRTVDKDDCLVGRGANPRTGLITPDWKSVV